MKIKQMLFIYKWLIKAIDFMSIKNNPEVKKLRDEIIKEIEIIDTEINRQE